MYDHNTTGPKDAPKVTQVEKDGRVVKLLRKDPYGLIYLQSEENELPDEFKGFYTSIELAEVDANRYLESTKEKKLKK